ncbi:other/AgaK1 protein kinase [Coprinopsis cinerea AmutBmut pab1-1]|nr:other/AgaK1 protein kinase [Coprinopsis cinerea AmutBmut pab1-1]
MMKLVQCDTLWATLRWSLHAWWHGYSVPTELSSWARYEEDYEVLKAAGERWALLRPFFASWGYHLYEYERLPLTYPPKSLKCPDIVDESYPYARCRFTKDEHYVFTYVHTGRIWAARDNFGRDVIIKLVSSRNEEQEELKVWKRLSAPEVREDPRSNRTLRVLDFITYDGLVFVVTPRWGMPFVGLSFPSVEHIFDMLEQFYDGLAFLHDNRIAHRDIDPGNMVMNALFDYFDETRDSVEIRDPSRVLYAHIDFEASALFAMDTDIDNVTMERASRLSTLWSGLAEGQRSNPFRDDVYVLTWVLQDWSRHIESIVPEIGSFYDGILKDYSRTPRAEAALHQLREIRSKLTAEQLRQEPPGYMWSKGKVLKD